MYLIFVCLFVCLLRVWRNVLGRARGGGRVMVM